MVSRNVYYNLGNAHFKLGNVAAAILFYERALRLAPQDEDIIYNLSIAEGLITDKIEPIEPFFLATRWEAIATSFSSTFWAILFLSLLTLSAVLLVFFFVGKNPRLKQLGLLGGLLVLFSAFIVFLLAMKNTTVLEREEAIVFASSVYVKSEPGLNATDQFVIHAGLKVAVEGEEGDWVRIRIADGNSGWLPAQSIERI